MKERNRNRRQFLKRTGLGLASASLFPDPASAQGGEQADRRAVVAALGDTLIPTQEPDYPGYRRLEARGITEAVLKGLTGIPSESFATFDRVSEDLLGQNFVMLDESGRATYLDFVLSLFPEGSFEIVGRPAPFAEQARGLEPEVSNTLQMFFRLCRIRILNLFYQNFPYHTVERDAEGNPIPTDEEHQIINPNRPDIVTGWDIAGYPGPLSWEEESRRRAHYMEIHWHAEGSKDNIG